MRTACCIDTKDHWVTRRGRKLPQRLRSCLGEHGYDDFGFPIDGAKSPLDLAPLGATWGWCAGVPNRLLVSGIIRACVARCWDQRSGRSAPPKPDHGDNAMGAACVPKDRRRPIRLPPETWWSPWLHTKSAELVPRPVHGSRPDRAELTALYSSPRVHLPSLQWVCSRWCPQKSLHWHPGSLRCVRAAEAPRKSRFLPKPAERGAGTG